MPLPIKGLQKTSLVDYPGKVSAVIFLGGCNFKCPFCHNRDLILEKNLPNINEQEIFELLEKRKKWLDGVVITGGEPCLYKELPYFIKKIKERGYAVKLDTNGTNPEMIRKLIEEKLIDYIALDIKNSQERYDEVTKIKTDISKIKKCVEIIKNSSIEYEFRSTILPRLHSKQDLLNIGNWLKDSKKFVLQQFRAKDCLDKEYEKEKSFSEQELNELKTALSSYFKKVEIRS